MSTKLTIILTSLIAGLALAAAVTVGGPVLADPPGPGHLPRQSTTTTGSTPPPTVPTTPTVPPRTAVEPPPEPPALPDNRSAQSPTDTAPEAGPELASMSATAAASAGGTSVTHPVLPATEAGSAIPAKTSSAGSASYERSNKGHRLWLDIRFDLDEYQNVVVDYGDGTRETLVDHLTEKAANVATGGTPPPPPSRWRTDHTYELTLIPVERPVTITWIGPSASDGHVEAFTMISVAVFDLTFHPLTFTAKASCDWHSKGDFTVAWDQGLGWHTTPEFELGKGESKTFDEFSFTRGGLTAETLWSEVLAMRMKEHDNAGAALLGDLFPDHWSFDGRPPSEHGPPPIAQELGDHTVTVTNARELGHECHVEARFDATLDLYEG